MTRIKGIPFWEQYIEYFVLGAVVLAAMAFVVMQFIGNPNAVENPRLGVIGPAQIDSALQNEATRINLLLATPHEGDPLQISRLAPEFEQSLEKSISPSPRIQAMYPHVPLTGVGNGADRAIIYNVPTIPTPSSIVGRQYHDTLSEDVVVLHGLHDRLPSQPYDISWVTAGGTFGVAETVRRFKAGNPQNGPAPIPPLWYDERSLVVNVISEREEFQNGAWVNRSALDPMPGQVHLRDILSESIDASRRDNLLRRIRDREVQTSVIQPPFYQTRSGRWAPPDTLKEASSAGGDSASDRVAFWSHDLTVEPGRVYRYRFVIEVYNPFCARKLNLVEEQHHLADSYVLRSEPSAWSEPITVEPPIRTFITRVDLPSAGALAPLGQTMPTASIEIYRFHDGRWREHRVTVQPGQRVGERRPERDDPAVMIDFGTEWYVLDIIRDPDARGGDARAARVVFQNIRTGEIEERHPLWDAPLRERLRDEIQQLASSTGG